MNHIERAKNIGLQTSFFGREGWVNMHSSLLASARYDKQAVCEFLGLMMVEVETQDLQIGL